MTSFDHARRLVKKNINEFRWVLLAFACLLLFYGVSLIFFYTKHDDQRKKSRESLAIQSPNAAVAVNQYKILAEKRGIENDVTRQTAKTEGAIETLGRELPSSVPGISLSESELTALHEKQEREIRRNVELNSIVIPFSEDESAGLTVAELKAIHAQQEREIRQAADPDEIIIPPSEDIPLGMTRRELAALHEQQKREMETIMEEDEIIIPPSEDIPLGMTRRELAALHEQQKREMETMMEED